MLLAFVQDYVNDANRLMAGERRALEAPNDVCDGECQRCEGCHPADTDCFAAANEKETP